MRKGYSVDDIRKILGLNLLRVMEQAERVAREVIELSSKEFRLLRYLIEHRGVSLSREELLKNVWGYDSTPLTRTVDVHIAWLRQKLETNPRNPQWILTVHGMGYKFIG